HTMLKAEDLSLYVVAIKSLLRYVQSVAVVVHDDGTLDECCLSTLRKHVPGCRLVLAGEADSLARGKLASNGFLSELRGYDASWRRLIDPELWARGERRIIMDSDILVVQRPDQVIDWIKRGGNPFLLGQQRDVGGSVTVQTLLRDKLVALSESLGWPN